MADSIDELKIEIEAEASNASDSITGLVNELTSLNNIVSKLDTSKLTSLATSLQNLGNIKFGNTSSELQKLDSQIDKVTSDASKNLSDKLIDAFNISDREAKKSVNSMSKSYMQLNKDFTFDTSIENVQKLTDALKELQDVAKSGARGEVIEDDLKDFYDEWSHIGGSAKGNKAPLLVDENILSNRGIDQWKADLNEFVAQLTKDTEKATQSIDKFYQEMSGKYPTLFPQDIILPISQYEQILGTVERYKAELKDTKAITEEWGMSLDEIVQKLASETSNETRYQYQDILGTENASGASLQSAYAQIQAESKAAEEANQGSFQGTIDSITRLTDAIKSIPKDDRLGQFAIDLEKLCEVTSKLSGVSEVADGLTKLVTVAANFPKRAVFNDFITSLRLLNDTAEYKNLDDIANYIDRLSESMMKFSEMRSYRLILDTGESVATAPPANESDVKTTEELSEANRDLSSSAEEATQAVDGLKEAIDNQSESQKSGISSTNGIKENLDETADAEKKAGQSAQETGENVYTLGDAFKNVQSSVKSFCSAVIDVGKEVVNADFSMIGAVLNEAAEGAQALGSGALDASKNIAKLVLQSTPIAKIGDSFDALGRSSDKLSREISRLTRMFSNLVLRTAMRSVIGDLDTSFQHLAQESSNVNEKVSSLMSSLSQLSHSIAALAEPILDIVGPALEYLISMLNTAITYVNQFLAALTGKTYVTGSYVASDYAQSISTLAADAEDAADAQGKLNKQLQGFNELNNLTTTDTSSGSGGSGGGGTGGGGYEGGYFEDLDISQDIQDFVDKLLEAWENSDFTEIGNILGEKLKEALESIPWDEIQYYAWKIAHSLATLINGFIETEGLGETIGNTLGEAINTALIFADTILQTLEWDNLGIFIADIVNGAIESVNWELLGITLGDAIAAWLEYGFNFITHIEWSELGEDIALAVNDFVDLVNDALTNADYNWQEVGSGFAEGLTSALTDIHWDDIGVMVGNGINVVLDNIAGFVRDFPYEELGSDLAEAMNNAFATIHWDEIGTTIKNGINGIFSSVGTWAAEFDFESLGEDIATSINNALSGINWDTAITAAKDIGSGISSALEKIMTRETFENVGSAIAGALNTAIAGVGEFLDDTNFYQIGQSVAAGINKWLADMDFKEMGRTLGKVLQSAIDFLAGLIDGLTWADVKQALEDFFSGMAEEVNMGTVGAILATALGVWIAGNLVSGVISAIGTGLGLKLALGLSGLLSEGISLGGAATFAGVTAAIVLLLGDAILAVKAEDITGGPEALVEAVQGVVEEACGKLDDLSKPGGALYEFSEAFRNAWETVWNATLGKLGLTWPGSEEEEGGEEAAQPEGEAYEEGDINLKVGVDKASAESARKYLDETFPRETELNLIETATFYAKELVDNIDDKDKVIECLAYIYEALFDSSLSDTQIEGLTGVIDYLETSGQLEVGNVIASVYAYGKLVELQDNLDDEDKVVDTVGELVELFLGKNTENYDVGGLTGELVDLVMSGADPVDIIGRIIDFMVENGITAQTEAEITDFIYDHDQRVGLDGEVRKLFIDTANNNSANRVEIIGEITEILFGGNATEAQIEGVTAIINQLEYEGRLTLDNVMAYVQAYAELVKLQDNIDDKDKVIEAAGEIVKIFTGGTASDTVIEGLTGLITSLMGDRNLDPIAVLGEIVNYFIANGLYPEIDSEADVNSYDDSGLHGLRATMEGAALLDQFDQSGLNGKTATMEGEAEVDSYDDKGLRGLKAQMGGEASIDSFNTQKIDGKVVPLEGEAEVDSYDDSGLKGQEVQMEGEADLCSYTTTGLNGELVPLDAEGNITDVNYRGRFGVDVDGNMKDLDVPNSLKNIQGMTGYISQALSSGQLSVSDVRAMVSQAVANGQLSMNDVRALVDSVEAQTGVSLTTGVRANSIDANGQSVSTMIRANSFDSNGNYATAPIYAASFNNNGKNATAPIYASEFNRNGKNATTPIYAASFENNGKNATTKILASMFDNNGKNATTKVLASAFDNNGKNATTKVLASAFDNNGKNATTKVLASAFDNNGKNATTKILASAFDNNGKNATTKVLASSFDNNGKNATTKVLASSFDNNGKNATTKILASSFDNNGKNVTTKILASSFSNNGNKFTTTFYASSLSRNGNTFSTTFYASSLSRNGHTFSTTFYASGFSNNGNKFSTIFYASSLNKNGCSISLSGSVRTTGLTALMTLAQSGGVFQHGRYSSIPQYDSGTLSAGSFFIAGERGPELVGHIGGRTEVLNASQLASVMRDSVVAGIAGIASYLNAIHSQMMTNANGIINAIIVSHNTPNIMPSGYGSGTIDDRFAQMQDDTDQIIGLLSDIEENTRDIGEIDISTDPDNMFSAMRKKNREYILKTGKSAFDY